MKVRIIVKKRLISRVHNVIWALSEAVISVNNHQNIIRHDNRTTCKRNHAKTLRPSTRSLNASRTQLPWN